MTDEYRKTCSKCRKRKRSRVYYELREGKTVWLCPECWEEEEKAGKQVRALVAALEAEPMKRHTFTDHGGQTATNGKPMWPDYLELIMDKRRAFDFVQSVLRQLADDEDEIMVTIVGKMESLTR